MTNVFFPNELVKTDDLFFVCYMIERVARQLKQPNKYVANIMGHDELAKKLSLADVLHSENPLAVAADWIDEYQLEECNYDVTINSFGVIFNTFGLISFSPRQMVDSLHLLVSAPILLV